MERRVWVNVLPGGHYWVRIDTDPAAPRDTNVTVRGAAETPAAAFDGVWLNGERSYDTWVLINGQAVYHAPSEYLAEASFDAHERAGGGHSPLD